MPGTLRLPATGQLPPRHVRCQVPWHRQPVHQCAAPPLSVPCVCWTPWPPRPCGPPQARPLLPPPFSSGTSRKEQLASPQLRLQDMPTSSLSTSGTSITRTPWSAALQDMDSSPPFGVSIPGNRASPRTSGCAVPPTPPTMTCSSPYATHATFPSTSPLQRSYPNTPHVMALSSSKLEVQDTHAWMIAGHRDTGDAHRAGWPRVSSRPTPPPGRHKPPHCPLPRNSRHHPRVFLDPGELRHPP